MSLFATPIELISYDDIESFCAGRIAENYFVDYKKELPDDIAKDVAAMANAIGGLILIGISTVGEDSGQPGIPDEIFGIEHVRKCVRSIISKCGNAIHPALIPEIGEVQIPNSDRHVVVLKISASASAPHWFGNSDQSTIPIRVQDFTIHRKFVRLVRPNELEDFSERRKVLKTRRSDLLDRARSRCDFRRLLNLVATTEKCNLPVVQELDLNVPNSLKKFLGLIEVSVSPSLPSQPIFELRKLISLAGVCKSHLNRREAIGTSYETASIRSVEELACYIELTTWGSFFISQQLGPDRNHDSISLHECFSSIGKCLALALCAYEQVDYLGLLKVTISVSRAGKQFWFETGSDQYERYKSISDDIEFSLELDCYSTELLSLDILKRIVEPVVFGVGLGNQDVSIPLSATFIKRAEEAAAGMKEYFLYCKKNSLQF